MLILILYAATKWPKKKGKNPFLPNILFSSSQNLKYVQNLHQPFFCALVMFCIKFMLICFYQLHFGLPLSKDPIFDQKLYLYLVKTMTLIQFTFDLFGKILLCKGRTVFVFFDYASFIQSNTMCPPITDSDRSLLLPDLLLDLLGSGPLRHLHYS